MLGAIFGDIVGSVYERNNVKTTDFQLITRYSRPTDDSILTLAVAKALMETWEIWSDTSMDYSEKNLVVFEALTANIQSMGRRYPNAGYGGTFRKWLCQNNPQPYGSWGNGSAMRVSSVGWLCSTLNDVLKLAALTASVTHNSTEGIKGAQAIASCVFMARSGMDKTEIRQACIELFGYDLSRTLDEIRPSNTFDVSCQGAVPEAILVVYDRNAFDYSCKIFQDIREFIGEDYIDEQNQAAINAAADGDLSVSSSLISKGVAEGLISQETLDKINSHIEDIKP